MAANDKEREFRYICQWFNEFSEIQREDFVPILVDYLTKEDIYMNGVVSGLAGTGCNDKPMSLFQCRIKLFKEWIPKWTEEMKVLLKEKIIELDPKIGEKLEQELATVAAPEDERLVIVNGNGIQDEEKENDENLGTEANNRVEIEQEDQGEIPQVDPIEETKEE